MMICVIMMNQTTLRMIISASKSEPMGVSGR